MIGPEGMKAASLTLHPLLRRIAGLTVPYLGRMSSLRSRSVRSLRVRLGLAMTAWSAMFHTADAALAEGVAPRAARPLNVLVLIIDDHGAQLHDVFQQSPVATPNMRRLSERSTWFTRAYVAAPACCPSRTALLTGVHPARSGVYYNSQAYRRASTFISKVATLPGHFKAHGYLTAGYGKIAHNRFLQDDVGDYTSGYYKMLNRAGDVAFTEAQLLQQIVPGTKTEMWHDSWDYGVLPDDWDRDDPLKLQQDTEQANRTIALLQERHEQPFFVACGFWRPHVSWTVAKRYFDRYPPESLSISDGYKPFDLDDLPKPARWLATHRGEHAYIVAHDQWEKSLQAYYASIAYVDEQIGRVLDALDAGPNAADTVVVFLSDNGWHTGEKDHWSKFYLSELACRVVFSISAPGAKPQRCDASVSLLDAYPTLVSLCGLPAPTTHELDGVDLGPLVRGASDVRRPPVVSTYGRGCHTIRDARYRYTRYRNGDEELYDHQVDPHEWTNRAGDPQLSAVKMRLAAGLPKVDAADVELIHGGADEENAWSDEAFR